MSKTTTMFEEDGESPYFHLPNDLSTRNSDTKFIGKDASSSGSGMCSKNEGTLAGGENDKNTTLLRSDALSGNTLSSFSTPTSSKMRRRYVSLDDGQHRQQKELQSKANNRIDSDGNQNEKQRSYSMGSNTGSMMKSLNFEEIDVDGTPLSSHRSCSEFLRYNSLNNQKIPLEIPALIEEEKTTKRSFFSSWFGRSSTSQTQNTAALPPSTKRVQFLDEDEEAFLIAQLRGNSRTESTNSYSAGYRSSSSSHSQSHNQYHPQHKNGGQRFQHYVEDEPGCMDFVFGLPAPSSQKRPHIRLALEASNGSLYTGQREDGHNSHMSRGKNAILRESSLALDLIFGTSIRCSGRKHAPMEIELKTLEPRQRPLAESATSRSHSSFSGLQSRSSMSGFSDAHSGDGETFSSSQHSIHALSEGYDDDDAINPPWWTLPVSGMIATGMATLSKIPAQTLVKCRSLFMGPQDDAFYEQIRIQPFATGGYLRGMLVAGFISLFFNLYCFAMWPDVSVLYVVDEKNVMQAHHILCEGAVYFMLSAQIFFNVLQLPLRLSLHLQCWESSRTIDVDVAIDIIRNMLQSDIWLCNRVLGRILDVLSVITLVSGEIYMRMSPPHDPLQGLIVSLCATNLLALLVRLVMSVAFALSMHDPMVLSDARRRGLSKWDLAVLPAFVYARRQEVTNSDCSICLASFDIGEMLISLPCDKKHSFHASCIRQWLERQNSCPLCQKLV